MGIYTEAVVGRGISFLVDNDIKNEMDDIFRVINYCYNNTDFVSTIESPEKREEREIEEEYWNELFGVLCW